MGPLTSDKSNALLTEPRSLDECLDIVVAWIESIRGPNFFVAPLEMFQSKYGKVNPDDEFYQIRMNYFLELCVLEFASFLQPGLKTIVASFFQKNPKLTTGDGKVASLWLAFCGARHGLFQVEKTGEHSILVEDLLFEKKISILTKSGETLQYLRKKSIFQCFVYGHHDQYSLGQGLIIHPELANKEITKFAKNYLKSPQVPIRVLLQKMAFINMRYIRMQHVNPAVIYRDICQ